MNEDGIDHINIYSKGETEIGRALSNFSGHRVLTVDGEFASIEAYWYWLNTSDKRREELRDKTGFEAKKLGRELRGANWNSDGVFKLKIAHAMLSKLALHPEIYRLFKESVLPFRHYYVYNGKITEPKDGRWIIRTWEFLRKMIQEEEKT